MGIKAHFKGSLDETFKALLYEVDMQIIESLCRVGEEAVKLAKLIPPERGFYDQSGNLRSSIGYVVFRDGKPVNVAFEAVTELKRRHNKNGKPVSRKKQDGRTGVIEGQRLAIQVGRQHPEGYTLVVVAGMNYAVYVESKGRDVLTSAEKQAEKQIAKELSDLVTNVKNAFK